MFNNDSTPENRRSVLRNLTLAAAAAAVAPVVSASDGKQSTSSAERAIESSRPPATDWLATADVSTFQPSVGSPFEFYTLTGRANAVLRAAQNTSGPRRNSAGNPTAFELEFIVKESTQNLPEGLCSVAHPKLGFFQLFVVRHRTMSGSDLLLASFSRLG